MSFLTPRAEEAAELLYQSRALQLLVDAWCRLDMVDERDAGHAILKAIRIQKEFGTEPELARSYLIYARLLHHQGETNKSKKYRDQPIDMFRRMDMQWDFRQAEQLDTD